MEQEVILLKAINDIIGEMVNRELMDLLGEPPEAEIMFKTMTHQRFFNIVLVDFLSTTDKKAPIKSQSYLGGLKEICNNPNFNRDNSVASLKRDTFEFSDWLNQIVEVSTWLPTIKKQVDIKISRFTFLKMTGNISKHNYLRAVRVAEELQKALADAGENISKDEALLSLTDFYERFHTDILNYHGNTIAEFLNNIRWGIQEYLQPEFDNSIEYYGNEKPRRYKCTYPKQLKSEYAKSCYRDLMNDIRAKPYIPKFKVSKWLKLRY